MLNVSTDKSKIDRELVIHYLLEDSYWAKNRSREQVLQSIEHSLCFVVLENDEMIGFARVISDHAVFAYLADVFIVEEHRGKGHGKLLLKIIFEHPELKSINRWMLGTKDAHSLYTLFGFQEIKDPSRWMERLPFGSEL